MTIGKTIALTRRTFVGKVMSLLLNMLSRLVITFLPRSTRLNFMAAVTICRDSVLSKTSVYAHAHARATTSLPTFSVSFSHTHTCTHMHASIHTIFAYTFKALLGFINECQVNGYCPVVFIDSFCSIIFVGLLNNDVRKE